MRQVHLLSRGVWASVPWDGLLLTAAAATPQDSTPHGCRIPGDRRPRLLVSGCLLGQPVTYRGKPSGWATKLVKPSARVDPLRFLLHSLCEAHGLAECVGFCPEMELLQLTAPRLPLRLTAGDSAGGAGAVLISSLGAESLWDYEENCLIKIPRRARQSASFPFRLSTAESATDPTREAAAAAAGALSVAQWLSAFDGVIVKAKSPSCGLDDARLYVRQTPAGTPLQQQQQLRGDTDYALVDGFFVKMLKDTIAQQGGESPVLPMISERTLKHVTAPPGNSALKTAHLVGFLDDVLTRFEWRDKNEQQSTAVP